MRKRWLGIFALCILVTFGRAAAAGRAEAAPPDAGVSDGYVIVKLAIGVSAQALAAEGSVPSLEDLGYRRVPVPAGSTREQFIVELQSIPGVISAEADARVEAATTPNDPYYVQNQAQYLEQIGLPAAWDVATGNNAVVVAVLDSGLDLGHPEFTGRLWENPADSFNDGVDHDNNKCVNDRYGCRFVDLTVANRTACGYAEGSSVPNGNVSDDNGSSHGTFVSGIIGASGNNSAGVSGVAWDVRIMPVKVLDCGTGTNGGASGNMSNVAEAILYAARMGANIINLSLSCSDQTCDKLVLRDAIQVAQSRGIIIVVAAGNYGGFPQPGPGYPAAYTEFPNLITVGASNNLAGNTWAPYSAYGPAIDFAAPGSRLSSTVRTDSGFSAPYGMEDSGGTSFAAPLVSGMFALMMSRNSRLPAADYIQIARDSATPATPAPHGQNWAGAGIINIGAAVARVPMSLSGAALRDWKDVPTGTEVRATIDGHECGTTTTFSIGPAALYALRVKAASEQAGCGVAGKVVQLSLGGTTAQGTILWGGRNENLGLQKDAVTVSPPPGAVVVQTLNGGWSNIAHFEAPGSLPGALSAIPTPWSAIYRWDPGRPTDTGAGGSYFRFLRSAPAFASDLSSIQTYDTYWVDAPATNIASLNPNPPGGRVLQLKPGWNNFVYTGTSRAVGDALGEITGKYSEVLQYDNATRAWLIHIPAQPRYLQDFGGLFKLKVYWIYMTQPGAITMN